MRKVKLHFTLVGKSFEWKRNMPKGAKIEFTNADNFEFVRDMVKDYFGDRALVMTNEHTLKNDVIPYPKYYSAGWFISEDEQRPSELVMVAHGETMADANKAMMDSIKSIDWDEKSIGI